MEIKGGEVLGDSGGGGGGADEGHADAAVEGFEHVGFGDVAELLDFFEHRKDAELGGVDGGVEMVGEDAVEITCDTAAGDVRDAVQVGIVEEGFKGFVVAGVGFEDGVEESFGLAVLVGEGFGGEVGVLGDEDADEGVPIGMEAVGGDGEDSVALLNFLAVDDFGFVDDADDGAGEDVGAGLENARLLGGFATDEGAIVLAAGVIDGGDELEDDVFLQFAADDAVLDREGLGANDDDVIDKVMDHVVGNGGGPVRGEGEFLFGAGLFGFHDEDGVCDAGEGGVEKAGESAGAVEDARVAGFAGGVGGVHRGGHLFFRGVSSVDGDAGFFVGERHAALFL